MTRWRMILQRQERFDMFTFKSGECWQPLGLLGVLHERFFDSKPVRQTPKDFFAAGTNFEVGSNDSHRCIRCAVASSPGS